MKSIPSLVASSTVGIAAAGLALGKPERATPRPPSSKKRKVGELADFGTPPNDSSSPASRPGTMSTAITPENKLLHQPTGSSSNPSFANRTQPPTQRSDLPPSTSRTRRLSMFRYGEVSSPGEQSGEENKRDSASSRSSWMKRLSTLPNSYNTSPRSSIGPDSPSITLNHGSAAPIFSEPTSSPAQLPPNKLVKRAPSGKEVGSITRTRSKTHVPTLRRPATSHQRSVTLQQRFKDDSSIPIEHQTPSRPTNIIPSSNSNTPDRPLWRPYFESRTTKVTKDRLSGRSIDGSMQDPSWTVKRIIVDDSVRPTLVKPSAIDRRPADQQEYYEEDSFEESNLEGMANRDTTILSIEAVEPVEPVKRPRRSLSLHFNSPGSWLTRSGSLRGNKRNIDGRGGKRHTSAPVSVLSGRDTMSAHGSEGDRPRAIMDSSVFEQQPLSPVETSSIQDPFATNFQGRSRNSSSPLPPLSRLSSFSMDLSRLGLSSSSSSGPRRSPSTSVIHTAATSFSSTVPPSLNPPPFGSHSGKVSYGSDVRDRASTLVGSDTDVRMHGSGEYDDLDFRSDTVYDSLRSGGTGSVRSRNVILDSMFDESPPSLNGHSNHPKNKRLSVHEILGNGTFSEGHNRIVEEDEDISTPVKGPVTTIVQDNGFQTPVRPSTTESNFPSSPPSFCLATRDFSRISLDDEEEDEDWTKDDENMEISNQLSPPNSSINSRRVSPSFRAALADVTRTNVNSSTSAERPKSNLFDWSEPSNPEKIDNMGNSPRPKTAHVNNLADGRGGRAVGRRGPSVLHVRSQSVPVVPDITGQRENTKLAPKFGTWGLGAKGVSEDWDNDFDFDNGDDDEERDVLMENSGMLIPPTIRASQANVVGHVGQIREVCLLVEDLKRLRLLAREKGLLDGASAPLWKEAEGIIALAVPDEDEEDLTVSPPHSPLSIDFNLDISDDKADIMEENDEDMMGRSLSEVPPSRPGGFAYDSKTVRRRSVFSPDDDIFGAGLNSQPKENLLPPSTSPRPSSIKSSSEVARSVMETMHQHRAISDPTLKEMSAQSSNKMPFDTTSLRDLVHRANVLSRTLGDLIRKSDGRSSSPNISPRRDSSPAFTRVFTDPMANPPKHLPKSHSNNSILSGSIDASPTRSLTQRMHMLTAI